MQKIKFVGLLLLITALSACNIVRGSGEIVTIERDVSNFDQVSLSGVGTLYITIGDEETLKIEAEDNVLPYIETRVLGSTLSIGFKDQGLKNVVQPTRPIHYYLTVSDLAGLDLSGAGNIEIEEISTNQLRISTSGAGNIKIEKLIANALTLDVSGAGNCNITEGQLDDLKLNISGAGKYQAPDLRSQTAAIDISGMGGAQVWVEEALAVEISGAGSVNYYGQPHVSQDISGAGIIRSLGTKQ